MQFKNVRIKIEHSAMHSVGVTCFEHEVPLYQAKFGSDSVTEMESNEGCGLAMTDKIETHRDEHGDPIRTRVPLDRTLEEEWERMNVRPVMVQVSETDKRPATMVAYPRGVLDLQDFYTRLRGSNVVPMQQPAQEAAPAPAMDTSVTDVLGEEPAIKPKSERDQMKEQLDGLGVEYKGNASNDTLRELLDEVTNVSTNVQN